jgi:hypothetical protein
LSFYQKTGFTFSPTFWHVEALRLVLIVGCCVCVCFLKDRIGAAKKKRREDFPPKKISPARFVVVVVQPSRSCCASSSSAHFRLAILRPGFRKIAKGEGESGEMHNTVSSTESI